MLNVSTSKISGLYTLVRRCSQLFSSKSYFFNIGHEDDVSLEPCSKKQSANMAAFNDSLTPYLYLHLNVIHNLGFLIPFTLFEVEFLATTNVSPSLVTPNATGMIRAFKIICWRSKVFYTVVLYSKFCP